VRDAGIKEEIRNKLLNLRDAAADKKIIKNVFNRHELYKGEAFSVGPDLVAAPYNGFDLKASFKKKKSLSERTPIVGMHTYEDAFIYIRGEDIVKEDIGIVDIMPTILTLLEVAPPPEIDGSTIV